MPHTTEHSIVERLRAMWFDMTAGGRVLINPDGPEAATLIETLLEERERMREALGEARVYIRGTDSYEMLGTDEEALLGMIDTVLSTTKHSLAKTPKM